VEYNEAYKRQVEARFEATLDVIQARGRNPTAWEAECLVEGIAAMAMESWTLAHDHIVQCGPDRGPRQVLAGITVDDLRRALAESRARRPRPVPAPQPQW
jgi:hypothetical protein